MQHSYRLIVLAVSAACLWSLLFHPVCLLGPCKWHGSSWGASRDIANATLGFQNIFVINLPARSNRRDSMTLSGALTELNFTWINGVSDDQVPDKILPLDSIGKTITQGDKGSWRAHMNVLQAILHHNLSSALILEDDIDWDIRLKSQLQAVSPATAFYLHLVASSLTHQRTITLPFSPPLGLPQSYSPYGSKWDVLWLGHCGNDFPSASSHLPLQRIQYPDETMPGPSHLRPNPLAGTGDIFNVQHPPRHRVVHAGAGTTCTHAYAVSLHGAARLLWKLGIETFTTRFDLMLRDWCGGGYEKDVGGSDRPVCVTVQPPLFVQHYGKGGESDITQPGGGSIDKEKELSPYLMKSLKLNMGTFVRGEGVEGCSDQWPD